MQNKSRAKKAAKTRANVRLGAKMGRTIEARQQAEKATMEKRAKAYLDMENDVCELATAAKLAMVVFESKDLSCSRSTTWTPWPSASGQTITRRSFRSG